MVTIILISALLAAGMLAVYLMLADTRSARYISDERRALYCAESGIAGARDYVSANVASWAVMLDGDDTNDPAGYPITGDLDGDGADDWQVTLADNDDEFPTNVPELDTDGAVFMVSRCVAYPETPREITALVSVGGGGTNYRAQAGHGGGSTGNTN